MKIYRYLFHKYYILFSAFTDSAGFYVNILLCWLLMFNSFTLVDYFLSDIIAPELVDKTTIIIYILLILAIHFSYFNSDRIDKIVNEEFNNENIKVGRLGILGAIGFVLITVWFFFNYTVPFVGHK
ncbi:hypothetical protein J1N10_12470 [Carboxylicivirga sp. A043]|uniref:hypothetical protein n=1 Tax=Carboxylicivirga litoralis TaxID=2816963 RepID=UPI0021CB4BC4|nr:hypothetical protein [Carboxylicivirga sp. A043]MCU4156796.1 hypothetical protein [Carboxylicivirga sp. A043]